MTIQTIRVELSSSCTDTLKDISYDIQIGAGLLKDAGPYIAPHLSRMRTAIITDTTVAALHLETLLSALDKAGISASHKILPVGEATKSFAMLEEVCDWLLAEKIERDDVIIALGGGVIGDLTGFAASILRRGVNFIQIPTSLLAQVDSAVGGKTAINVARGKNLIGAFHQPVLVLSDTHILASLPRRDFLSGYAEIVKYAALGDASFFAWLEDNQSELMARNPKILQAAIARSCLGKAAIIAEDEKENGTRALLNLGHTFGHAYEALTGYGSDLLHGEGVALGMVMAYDLSVQLGLCPKEDAVRLWRHLKEVGLPINAAQISGAPFAIADLIDAMAQDKKVQNGVMTFILVRKLGDSFISKDVTAVQLEDFLKMRDQIK